MISNNIDSEYNKILLEEAEKLNKITLSDLLKDENRNKDLFIESDDIQREKITKEAYTNLFKLADERKLNEKIKNMFHGKKINETENRSVLHVALRASQDEQYFVDGKNIVPDVYDVLNKIESFSFKIRTGSLTGYTGKKLTDVICIGIGGSYLGTEFVYEALRTHNECRTTSEYRRLRFLANVDPVDILRATEDFIPETTLIIIISKTFTTVETMLNANSLKKWLLDSLKNPVAIGNHMIAVSTNIKAVTDFGIKPENIFGFWDWVGGRFSVCSAVGALPLSIHFGYRFVKDFLKGCHDMDQHFLNTSFNKNIPVIMGLISVWNSSYLKHNCVALLPYSQSLLRFPAHIQQLSMESNGKRVKLNGNISSNEGGEIYFGEPGTNAQHSFYQLLHQGRIIPSEFIGFINSQYNFKLKENDLSNHDELMSNFFAQPDALAYGKTEAECIKEGIPSKLIPHKIFPGDRPSLSLLLKNCNPYEIGRLLSLYEHRIAVQGFIWDINSFDQWGVELGKVLAKNIRNILKEKRQEDSKTSSTFTPTTRLINYYCDTK